MNPVSMRMENDRIKELLYKTAGRYILYKRENKMRDGLMHMRIQKLKRDTKEKSYWKIF